MTCDELNKRIAQLWAIAEARRERCEPIRRDMLSRLAYTPPAGDGEISARAWLTEHEADELHAFTLRVQLLEPKEAALRIREKILARRAAVLR